MGRLSTIKFAFLRSNDRVDQLFYLFLSNLSSILYLNYNQALRGCKSGIHIERGTHAALLLHNAGKLLRGDRIQASEMESEQSLREWLGVI
ncbi:MAG TPA: hypothetical protein VKF38_09210 [Anaerolineaceae bacterium]|nr:hypothetical protein [Anaerolineaceae bacterium]